MRPGRRRDFWPERKGREDHTRDVQLKDPIFRPGTVRVKGQVLQTDAAFLPIWEGEDFSDPSPHLDGAACTSSEREGTISRIAE